MKKNFLALFSLLLLLAACGQNAGWSDEQKASVRDAMTQQRERFSLQYMEDKDFSSLQECALSALSDIFPEFGMYDSLPDRDATLDGIVTDCMSDMTGADYEHLEKLLPYARLADAGLVPAEGEQSAFYECLSGYLRGTYFNTDVFVASLLIDPSAPGNLRETIRQCGLGNRE